MKQINENVTIKPSLTHYYLESRSWTKKALLVNNNNNNNDKEMPTLLGKGQVFNFYSLNLNDFLQ